MSWISENYEKAALGAAAAIALGLAYAGWSKTGSVETNFNVKPRGDGSNDTAVKDGDLVATANSSFKINREWKKGEDNGRPVDLFTGVPLFVNKNSPNTPVDLIEDDPVHPPIPNQWWIDNRIDPGFGDSPQRDADGDGFSNLEEFNAKTDPNDKRDYPSLIEKLTYVGDESIRWAIRPGFPSAEGSFSFEYSDTAGVRNRNSAANPIEPGGLFFSEDPMKERFKYVSSEVRKVRNERFNTEIDTTFVIIEDQKANKKGTKYEIPANFRKNNEEYAKHSQHDRTAILSLEALGLGGQEIKVEEFTNFALPPGSETKSYKLAKVTPEAITVEHTTKDGKTETHVIQKGATGSSGE